MATNPPTLETIPIVCINLDSRPDRWANMERRLEAFGLTANLTRKSACTPAQLNRYYVSNIAPGLKACSQSHLEVWEAFLASQNQYILILEDDVQFRKDWVPIVNQRLATIHATDPQWHALFLNVTEELPTHETWMLANEQYMTGATIYSRPGVERLLRLFGPSAGTPYYGVDWMTRTLQCDRHCYTYFPWLAVQEGTYSDIKNAIPQPDYDKMRRLLRAANYDYETNYV